MQWIKRTRDSKLRDLSESVTGLTSGRLLLRRRQDRVLVVFDDLVLASSGNASFPRLPSGLRPAFRVQTHWYVTNSSTTPTGTLNISPTGYFNVYGVTADQAMTAQVEFTTADAFPSSWPGIEVP